MPNDGKQWVKMLFNAKTRAEEVYKEGPNFDWKPVIHATQLDSLGGFYSDREKWSQTRAWIEEHFDVIDDRLRMQEVRESWAKIRRQLDDAYNARMNMTYIAPQRGGKTWLGSQLNYGIIDERFRVPEVREVPGVRDFSWSYGPVHFDRKDSTAKLDHGSAQWSRNEEGSTLQLQEWLQRRGICRRASSCGVA